ncbi:SGNH/GDSL hydrolase family protein [Nocardioides speluncae]|uniref:SGNH/GDSL hydrolase family protein n=1 Tax=Nocardioides speluncae TaxID=2670337 RepID=UPI000D699458|nr:SGNH/GDSL hydrolase family protein [Nocardioides speluncae]
MSKLRNRIIGTAIVTGVLGGVGAGLFVGGKRFLARQAAIARGAIGQPHGFAVPKSDKVYKKRYGEPIDLLIMGDSIAAGLGADTPRETLGARLAQKLARKAHRAVRLRTVARVGGESHELVGQLDRLPKNYRPDVAVIVVGGNDVTHRIPVAESIKHLQDAIRLLQERDCRVVVGTCPDLGALRPVPQPLRALGSRASRQLAAAQQEAVLELGERAVSLAKVVGPFFITNPDEMFSLDRMHPSSLGYKRTAKAILPSVLAALGIAERVPFGHHHPQVPVGAGR